MTNHIFYSGWQSGLSGNTNTIEFSFSHVIHVPLAINWCYLLYRIRNSSPSLEVTEVFVLQPKKVIVGLCSVCEGLKKEKKC